MTAEQKYLKALAEWLDIETIPKNRIQEASKEYLDQFVGVNEKAEPTWTPEVGKLYKGDLGVIEVTKILDYGIECYNLYAHGNYKLGFKTEEYKSLIPIAELEGLKVGYTVYTYGNDGKVHSFFIEGKFPFDDFITIKSTQGGYRINITLGGYFPIISNKQLFWRTADRAERFGRGDA